VDRTALNLWSRSSALADIQRVAILSYPPLLTALERFEPDLHELIAPLLPTLRRLQKMESVLTKAPFTPAQLARAFSLLLAPPEEIKGLLEKVQTRFYDTSVTQLRPLLRAKEKNPDGDHVLFLLFCALDQRHRLLTRSDFIAKELADIKKKTEGLDEIYVLMILRKFLPEQRLFLGPFGTQLLIHAAIFGGFYLIVMGLDVSPNFSNAKSLCLGYLSVPFLGAYLFVFMMLRAVVCLYLKRFAEAHLSRFALPSEPTQEAIERQATRAGWKGQSLAEIRSLDQIAREQYNALPKNDQPAEPLPPLPEPIGLDPFFWMAAGLIVYCGLEPLLLLWDLGYGTSLRDDDPWISGLLQSFDLVWVTLLPLLLMPVIGGLALYALGRIPVRKPTTAPIPPESAPTKRLSQR
jgi:hypothetical protein